MHADNPAAFEFSLVNIGSEFNLIASDQTGAEVGTQSNYLPDNPIDTGNLPNIQAPGKTNNSKGPETPVTQSATPAEREAPRTHCEAPPPSTPTTAHPPRVGLHIVEAGPNKLRLINYC